VAVLTHGRIEQIGVPAEIYNEPQTPFVAEFIGTMNRLEATVTDDGEVDFKGTRLRVDQVRGRRSGERVLVLVRPETLAVEPSRNGAGLGGEVVAQIFLGATTRLKLDADGHELSADVPSSRASKLPVGSRVSATFPAESARVLQLEKQLSESPAAAPAGR
jgi:putative spermidine/putrescine transport system ATP-binding protein